MNDNYPITRINFEYFRLQQWIFSFLFVFCFSSELYSQKQKDILPLVCVKKIDKGLFQATFSYENPTKKEVVVDENASIIKSNNGKKVAKGLNNFKPGLNKKVFTKEFGPHDFIEWTITSNGNTHTVVANVNSGYCEPDDGFIFPVIGNGKSSDLIGQELTAICDNVVGDNPSDLIFQVFDEKVLVEIIPVSGKLNDVIALLETSVFNIEDQDYLLYSSQNPDPFIFLNGLSAIDVYINTSVLCDLNDYPEVINFARPVYPSIKNEFNEENRGLVVSQGDATQTTDIVRESFKLIDQEGRVSPVDGTGITIGVMSNSYDKQPFTPGNPSKATLDVWAGDLPGTGNTNFSEPVNVLMDYPYGEASDEGRAMMHIIHDVAPGASLAFYAASVSPRVFETGFGALSEISDIIVDDITFITEPFFGGGKISVAIDEFVNTGGIHFTSAGNFGDFGYQSVFNSSSTVPTTNFIAPGETRAHVFGLNDDGSEDYLQKISVVPGTYMIALQWKEDVASQYNETGAVNDLDIYIVDDAGRLLVGSNRVNIAGDPTEVIVFKSTGTGEANILITSANGATTVPFRYIAFQSKGLTLLEYDSGSPTISGHAMTENSVAVGAIRYNKTEPEVFSSFGGVLSDGTSVNIDFAAPDGVDTNVGSIGIRYFLNGEPTDDTPEYPNFFGTSASAPSAAAAVALLQSALPTWYPHDTEPGKSSKSVSEVVELFKNNVRDGSSPNPQAGAGMIDANKVFNSLAAQTARITSFEFVPETDSENAGSSNVTIRIIGEFLPVPDSTEEPVVYLDGEPVPFTIEDGVIYAKIPPFSGNPDLQIYTQPKEGSEGNGGFSEPYKFFQDGKNIITVTASPVTVKFGESYKSQLAYTLEGIELPEGEASYASLLSDLGFPDITLKTTVDNIDYPDVKNYPITPSFEGDFIDSDEDSVPDVYDQCPDTANGESVDVNGCSDVQKEEIDFTPAITYKVNFITGNLAVEKNNLIIKPKEITSSVYGDKIAVELLYSGYGTTNEAGIESFESIHDPEAFLAKIKSEHLKDFYKDAASGIIPIGLINNFKSGETFDVNGVDRYQDILDLLENGSWISSENTFLNRLEQYPYRGGSYEEDSGYPERVYGSVNLDQESAFINFNTLDFTGYLDEFAPDKSIENGQALGIINGQALGIINGQSIGIINGQALGIINGQAIGIINGQAIGIVNGQAIGIVNGQSLGIVNGQAFGIINGQAFGIINNDSGLGSGTDTNDYNKVFSVIDATDYAAECLIEGDCSIAKYHALNLITGTVVTNSIPHYIFSGSFINPMSDNFNIIYEKSELSITKKDLKVSTAEFSIPYGSDINAQITTEFDFAYNDSPETVFPNGIPYYFKSTDESDTKEYVIGDKMDVGTYTIKIRDVADNYSIVYGDDHGQLTITEATLTVIATETENISYGGTPIITAEVEGFAFNDDGDDSNDESILTLFPENEGGIPYYFMKIGETPDCETCVKYYLPYESGNDKMDVGEYDIFIGEDGIINYKIVYASDRGSLTIEPATLTITTSPLSLAYGTSVSENIETTINGFAYEDENASTVYPDGSGGALLPYVFKDEEGSEFGTEVKNLGTYTIEVSDPVSGNYLVEYGPDHGGLTIGEAILTFTTVSKTIGYGESVLIDPGFEGFADGESEDVLHVNGKIPYFFMKQGDTPECGTCIKYDLPYVSGAPKMDVGQYTIFIEDDKTDNYKFINVNIGTLTIGKAVLEASILPNELIVNQGEEPVFETNISGYKNGDTESEVFPSGIPYYFVDESGFSTEFTDNTGVYSVQITDPLNYNMNYINDPKLLVNPFGDDIRKVRTYADCVRYNGPNDYTVIYRYENANDEIVYVPAGEYNNLSGTVLGGELPTFFMPGSATFEIRFDGNQLTWSLTTYGSTNKSSVSSLNQSGTGECDAKISGASYLLYPNPVTEGILNIEQFNPEVSIVYILDIYGRILHTDNRFDGFTDRISINMSDSNVYPGGLYIVKIVSLDEVKTYNIIKE
ncbi:S8 family peptidase [Lutimonas zeaxanthinifaciens]|uniref:S8 family peptidase n=1 Tax=Lutimonas zeaxanthinifaciens TaxID=3060215 RepID=UPI00265D5956|nr:S8 family peptidase [Lutimonas sp. YSD2104]WKK66337.1 S8 family peptidase [Lutimonas sp. YSD2104]